MNSPRPPRKTILTSLTNLIQGGATKVKFSQLKLKPNAKVPEVWVQLPEATKAEVYPLPPGPQLPILRHRDSQCPGESDPCFGNARSGLGLFRCERFQLREEGSTNSDPEFIFCLEPA
jgi:hypothetical protein